jgi:magnesium-transporting ATPase (P-type)
MDPTFGHPLWIFVGAVLVLVGLWLFLWATGSNTTGRSASATEQGKLRGLFRRRKSQPNAPSTAATNAPSKAASNFRRAMSQLFGIIGFLMIIAGLMAAVLGVFYPGE